MKKFLTFIILLYIIDETIKYIVLKNTIEERTLSVIFWSKTMRRRKMKGNFAEVY